MKNKLLKLSMWQGIIAAGIFVINYFFYHFVTDEGISLVWQPEAGKPFVADLIGLEIYDEQGKFYGKLTDVLKTGANDVYELKDGDKTYYIPAIPSVVLSTDIEGGKMIIWPMEGLFE